MKIVRFAVLTYFVASACLADATMQQKTEMRFGGAIGDVINVFGRSSTHEGLTSETAVHGKRKSTRTGDSGEIIDLDQEKIYHVDYDGKTYTVTTFADLRKQYEDQKERARKQAKPDSKGEKGPEYEVDFSVKSTGQKESINGWNTHEEIATVTVREKGKKLEESGGFVLTADMWIGPLLSAMREMAEFDRKFMQKVYGSAFEGDMRQMAAMMAATPAFAKAMKTFGEKSNVDGTPIRTTMTFETVAGTNQTASEQSSSPSPAAAIGGLLGRMRKRREEGKDGKPSDPNRSTLLTSNSELLKATTKASADAVALPLTFTKQ